MWYKLLCTISILALFLFAGTPSQAQMPVADFSIDKTFLDMLTTPGNFKIQLQDQSVGATSVSMEVCDDLMISCSGQFTGSNPIIEFQRQFSDYWVRVIATNAMGADTLDSLITVFCGNLTVQPSAQCTWQLVGDTLSVSHIPVDDNSWDPGTTISGPGVIFNPWCPGHNACSVKLTQTGTFTICGDWYFGTCSQTVPVSCCDTIEINCLPTRATWAYTVLGSQLVQFADTGYANANPQYLWDFGDGNTSTQQNPQHAYSQPGAYNVCLTVTDSCGTDQVCQTVYAGVTSAGEPELISGLRVSPNPSNGRFKVEFNSSIVGGASLSLMDVQGKVLWSRETALSGGEHTFTVDDAALAPGFYLFRVATKESMRHQSLQILR